MYFLTLAKHEANIWRPFSNFVLNIRTWIFMDYGCKLSTVSACFIWKTTFAFAHIKDPTFVIIIGIPYPSIFRWLCIYITSFLFVKLTWQNKTWGISRLYSPNSIWFFVNNLQSVIIVYNTKKKVKFKIGLPMRLRCAWILRIISIELFCDYFVTRQRE